MPTTRETTVRSILIGSASLLLHTGSSSAAENFWTGAISPDWQLPANWSLGLVPTAADNAHIDVSGGLTSPFPATIFSDVLQVGNILISRAGLVPNTPKVLNHTAGVVTISGNNWLQVGPNGGSGVYNLANVSASGGPLTGFGMGSGSITAHRIYVGGVDSDPAGGIGVMNLNTSGSVNVTNDLLVGVRSGRGILNIDQGTINAGTGGGWIYVGSQKGGVGSNGTINMSGGTLNNIFNGNHLIIGEGSATGNFNLTGGNVNNDGEVWIGQGVGSNGTMTVDGGSVTIANWLVIGRDGGTGTLNLTGGSITKGDKNGDVLVGSSSAAGRVNQSGGTFRTIGPGGILFGQNAGATSLWDLSDGTVQTTHTEIGWEGGVNELRVRNTGTWTTGRLNLGLSTNNGKGVVKQTGGTITSNSWIAVGLGSNQLAEYHIDGGTTNTVGLEVGSDSRGFVSVTGAGVLNVSSSIEVPTRSGNGTFNISGGTINTVKFEQGGRNGSVGTGVTNQSGGVVKISGNLDVQRVNVGTGEYNLSGGSLSVNGSININNGTFRFTGGRITRETPGVISINGALTSGSKNATFNLGSSKTFNINGAFNKVAGITLDLTGRSIPAWDGIGVDTGSFQLGSVDSIVGKFDPATDTIIGLAIANPFPTTFISEADGEAGLFDVAHESVYWIEENAGTVRLRFSIVPESSTASLIALSALAIALLRPRTR